MALKTARKSDPYAWCFVSGRIAALEERFVRPESLLALAEARDADAALKALGETPYADRVEDLGALGRIDRILDGLWAETLAEFRTLAPEPAIMDLFVLEADFQNYKAWLKSTLFELPYERLDAGAVEDEAFERVWEGLHTPAFDLFGDGTARLKGELEQGNAGPMSVDWIFDAELLAQLEDRGEAVGSELIGEAIRRLTRLRTGEVVMRAAGREEDEDALRRLFIAGLPDAHAELAEAVLEADPDFRADPLLPYLEWEAVLEVEQSESGPPRHETLARDIERAQMLAVEPAARVTFGPERVYAYLVMLRNEIRNLKIAVGGTLARIEPDVLKDRLVLPPKR